MAESSLRNVRARKGFFQWLEVAGLYSVAVLTEGWTAVTFAIALLVVCAIGIGASLLMTQASNRSALWIGLAAQRAQSSRYAPSCVR